MEEETMSSHSNENKSGVQQHSKEEQKIHELRAFVRAKDPSFKEEEDQKTDYLTLRRFLRARELDVEKAGALFCKYLSWRRSFVPKGSISEADIPYDLGQNKMFLQGRDKKGRPISVNLAARHFYNKQQGGLDEFKRFIVFTLDKICARMPPGHEKFVAIGDLKGWGYCNSDIRGYLASISILQDFYPERLGKVYILHAPRIFMTVWKIVYPFIDIKTRAKIVFVEDKSLKSTLLEDIDEAQLPEMYGGKLPLTPIHQC